jgi:cell division septation protein DedD
MIAPSESNTNSNGADRRSCGRQRVLFSSVVLNEGNCGRVLNISPNGLALQTDTELVGEEFPFRFKFSPSLAWVEAKGRVAWRNDSKNVVGIEFIGLTDEVQRQIKTWMDWKKESIELPRTDLPSTNALLQEGAQTSEPPAAHEPFENSEIGAAWSTAASVAAEDVDLNAENQKLANQTQEFLFSSPKDLDITADSQESQEVASPDYESASLEAAPPNGETQSSPTMTTVVRDPVETQEFPTSHEVKMTRGIGTQIKLVGLALLIIFLVGVIFFRRNHSQAPPSKGVHSSATVRVPREPVGPDQAAGIAVTPSTPSAKSSGAVSPASPALPHTSASNQTPTAHGSAFVLQVAAMLHQENANALKTKLRDSNFPAFVTKLPTERFHHVLVGPFNSASAAMDTQTRLEQLGYKPIRTEWKASSH